MLQKLADRMGVGKSIDGKLQVQVHGPRRAAEALSSSRRRIVFEPHGDADDFCITLNPTFLKLAAAFLHSL
jgi:hypothetical protein